MGGKGKRGNRRLRVYTLIIALGFFIVPAGGMLCYRYSRHLADERDGHTRLTYQNYIDFLNKNVLANMASYISKEHRFLSDTERLRREGALRSDWFWDAAAELSRLKDAFGFAYIYYIEKTGAGFVFLASSDIRRDNHPEWLHTPVWKDAAPPFFDAAWETGKLTYSPEPTRNEWGELITAALPVLGEGKVVGIIGVDYDVSSLTRPMRELEDSLVRRQDVLLRRLLFGFIIFTTVILAVMAAQIMLDRKSVLLPAESFQAAESARLIMDATPMACSIWDSGGTMLDCNREVLAIFGLSQKSDYIEHFYDLNPEYQPDGESTRDKTARLIQAALETGRQRFEWTYRTPAGDPLPVETTLVRVPWEDGYRVTAYSRDLREIRAKEAETREAEERMPRIQSIKKSPQIAQIFTDYQDDISKNLR